MTGGRQGDDSFVFFFPRRQRPPWAAAPGASPPPAAANAASSHTSPGHYHLSALQFGCQRRFAILERATPAGDCEFVLHYAIQIDKLFAAAGKEEKTCLRKAPISWLAWSRRSNSGRKALWGRCGRSWPLWCWSGISDRRDSAGHRSGLYAGAGEPGGRGIPGGVPGPAGGRKREAPGTAGEGETCCRSISGADRANGVEHLPPVSDLFAPYPSASGSPPALREKPAGVRLPSPA